MDEGSELVPFFIIKVNGVEGVNIATSKSHAPIGLWSHHIAKVCIFVCWWIVCSS